jgi:aldehyde dehydrogenase (NAD+)/betaine-aldehyde dehydrogenase
VHDEVVGRLKDRFEAMRTGPGAADLDLGPLISAKQRDRVLSYIDIGRKEAKLITGGAVPDEPSLAGGFFIRPTIFDDVPPGATIAQEEIFGPVLCVHRFTGPAEAAAIANDTSYGLSAGIWTRDIGLAHALVRELRAGQVFVNNYSAAGGVDLPFGGYRRSGIGREKGFDALREFTRTKAVAILSPGGLPPRGLSPA